jgi:hypothetical protein
VAIANRIARTLYHIIKNADERYKDIGGERVDPKSSQLHRLIKKIEIMGFNVQLSEKSA